MSGINRKNFFEYIRSPLFEGALSQSQVSGLDLMLDYWEQNFITEDPRWLAYILATAYHETARTMQPIEEYGKGAGKPYGNPDPDSGLAYFGRGFVQLTWKSNYARMGRMLSLNLVEEPEKALDPDVSVAILFIGMVSGMFTGKRLVDYLNKDSQDWEYARKVVNGLDRATDIASHAQIFLVALTSVVPAQQKTEEKVMQEKLEETQWDEV